MWECGNREGELSAISFQFAGGEPGVPARLDPSTPLRAGSRDARRSTLGRYTFLRNNAPSGGKVSRRE